MGASLSPICISVIANIFMKSFKVVSLEASKGFIPMNIRPLCLLPMAATVFQILVSLRRSVHRPTPEDSPW